MKAIIRVHAGFDTIKDFVEVEDFYDVVFPCPECGKRLKSPEGVIDHKHAVHGREQSFAERAIEAEIAVACGLHTDDDWLLP